MDQDILLIHLSENGELPSIKDKGYEELWNSELIIFAKCLEFKDGILEGAYKTINFNIHTEVADEVVYKDTTIVTEIHLNDINYICNNEGKILTTIEYEGQMIDFICDSIFRKKEYSLCFINPVLTEYECIWGRENKLKYERENEIYKYFASKLWHNNYLGNYLPLDSVKLLRIEPYIEKEYIREAIGTIDGIVMVVHVIDKYIMFVAGESYCDKITGEISFNSISRLNLFINNIKDIFELKQTLDHKFRPQYFLKAKDGKKLDLEELQNIGVQLKRINHKVVETDEDYRELTWDAMTDGQYGDMPDEFDGDYEFLGLM